MMRSEGLIGIGSGAGGGAQRLADGHVIKPLSGEVDGPAHFVPGGATLQPVKIVAVVAQVEEWIAENMPRLRVNVAVAEGGSFSFISGATPRAPRWLRRMGLEWLYRLARQPWRLRRQLAILDFLRLVIRERLRTARGG